MEFDKDRFDEGRFDVRANCENYEEGNCKENLLENGCCPKECNRYIEK